MIPPGFKHAGAGLETSGNDDFYDSSISRSVPKSLSLLHFFLSSLYQMPQFARERSFHPVDLIRHAQVASALHIPKS
jgi:hypothetical protein